MVEIKKENMVFNPMKRINVEFVRKQSCGAECCEHEGIHQKTFKCWYCPLELDRDTNAARNILNSSATSSIGTYLLKREVF